MSGFCGLEGLENWFIKIELLSVVLENLSGADLASWIIPHSKIESEFCSSTMKLWIVLALISANACASKVNAIIILIFDNNWVEKNLNKQVKVDVYYESLCPDSIGFIAEQLKPIYKELKNHLDVTFVPFGKSSVSLFAFKKQHKKKFYSQSKNKFKVFKGQTKVFLHNYCNLICLKSKSYIELSADTWITDRVWLPTWSRRVLRQ